MSSQSLTRGGITMLVASVLLVVATISEIPLLGSPRPSGAPLWTFLVIFELSSLLSVLMLIGGLVGGIAIGGGSRRGWPHLYAGTSEQRSRR
jgi:hypothetical protein